MRKLSFRKATAVSGRYNGFWYFSPSVPREAKGGIKAQSRRGEFAQKWWAKRWIEVLESFNIGARLQRGRSYARRGQVTSIDISEGVVKAKVQGSRPKPYSITIKVKTISKADWKKLAQVLGKQAFFAAKLLAGEMPQDIESAFKNAGLTLLPTKSKDLQTDCSCPDWSNPCKHIAAVYYLLGEEFDRDPFLIFKLRGISREELIDLIDISAAAKTQETEEASPELEKEPARPEPLPVEPVSFWGENKTQEDFFGEVRVPDVPASLPKRLGNFPFWRGEENFLDAMERYYAAASPVGISVFLGEHKVASRTAP